jgi:hypothetical protein
MICKYSHSFTNLPLFSFKFEQQLNSMSTVTIDNKKFVVIEQKKFEKIQLLAAKKSTPSKKLSLAAGKKHALKLIDKWAKEK